MTAEKPATFLKWIGVVVMLVAVLIAAGLRLAYPSMSTLVSQSQRALEAGRPQLAIEKARQIVARDPDSDEGWKLLALAGIQADDRTAWEPAIESVEKRSPMAAVDLWVTLGSREMQRFHAAAAEQALRRAIGISRDRPEPWRLLAQLISVQGRPRETAECLVALIRIGDFTTADLHTLAWPNSALDDPARVSALLEADPRNLVPMLGRVGAALNTNRAADAESLLRTILARHPDSSRAIALLGRLLADRDAAEFPQWQRELSPRAAVEPEAWIAQGIWLRNHKQMSAAAGRFHRAVQLDPRHLNALTELGQTLRTLGEAELGATFLDAARRQQEISELAKRIEEQNEIARILELVERLEQVGRLWEAWAWCKVSLHASPGDAAATRALSRLKARLTPDLPRTVTDAVPGRDFDWDRLDEPDWSPGETPFGRSNAPEDLVVNVTDDSTRLGIDFQFVNGPPKGGTIVQTSGGGVAACDFDRDGLCDLYFTQGGESLMAPTQSALDRLYRNRGAQGFEDVTISAAIREDRFSQGVAAGDLDNDGFPDLYVANLGLNRLLRNNGDGTFTDVTNASGLTRTGWTTSCAVADLNGDGAPDLFSVRYAGGPEITSRVCRDAQGRPSVCRPTLFPAEEDLVAINQGDGTFTELCHEAGLDLPDGRGFGLVVGHFNDDRHLDLFISNDQTANFLLTNDGDRAGALRFTETAIVSGVAFDRDGYPQACMGVASGDINSDGRPDLYVTNFADESNTLYVSQQHGGYLDMTRQANLRDAGFHFLGFGAQFLDVELDGRLDLVVLNGDIIDAPESGRPAALRPQLYHGLADQRFAEVRSGDPESFFHIPRIGRGLCLLDWNRDGRTDFAASFLDGKAALVTNRTTSSGHWLAVEFVGVTGSRDAIGTRVRLEFADGTWRLWQATAGDGFAASNERGLHLGLGAHSHVAKLVIDWPSGLIQEFTDVRADTRWNVIEGRSGLNELPGPSRE